MTPEGLEGSGMEVQCHLAERGWQGRTPLPRAALMWGGFKKDRAVTGSSRRAMAWWVGQILEELGAGRRVAEPMS